MVTLEEVRSIALSLPGTVENADRFAFEVIVKDKRKGFTWIWYERVDPKKPRVANNEVLVVRVADFAERQALLASAPETYFSAPHYNGYPAVLVRLAAVERDELAELITDAWRSLAPRTAIEDFDNASVIERDTRLSQSILWRIMREFYDASGLDAWRADDPVPHYATTSPKVAHAYSRIIHGYLEDVAASPDFQADEPVYILELGSGHGRLGYRIVRRLLHLTACSTAGAVRWVYVLTDLSEANLASWDAQPRLRPLAAAGVLDFARFDIGNDDSLALARSGVVLSPGSVANPLVAVANYIFDSLPQDAFYVRAGALYERRVFLSTPQPEPNLDDPTLLTRVDITCSHVPASASYYQEPAWNAALEAYRDRLPEAAFLFPVGALDCVQKIERLSGGRALVLAGDKGWTHDRQFPAEPAPVEIAVHAGRAFSMMVNFDAIARYAEQRGGHALLPKRDATSLVVGAFLFDRVLNDHRGVRQRYAEEIDGFGPDDFYTLMRGLSERLPELTPEQLCATLQMADGDDFVLASSRPTLLEVAASFSDQQKRQLRNIVQEAWDGYLPIGEETDRAFQYGTLLYELGFHAEALELFDSSAQTHGRTANTVYNLAACEYALRQFARAREAVEEALALDSKHEPARELRLRLESAP